LLNVELDAASVKMCEHDAVEAGERFDQSDVQFGSEIRTRALEGLVLDLLEGEDDVAGILIR
jgi:hypothetical protein